KTRKDAMMRGLSAYMPAEFKYTDPDGGLFVWGEFMGKAKGLDTAALLAGSVERNVAYIQGKEFYPGGGGANTMRLNYSNASPERIDEGLARLGAYFKEQIAK
ncbi:MAG: aminotransferase, partial [Clostridiales bacterium]|nr:aminotransferase [Clostridiales bacterium]